MIDYAHDIKQAVTMAQVCEMYGISVNRHKKALCPFHDDQRQPSMHVYDGDGGFYCFTCQKGGSIIDFVMALFDLTFQDAMRKLNVDFSLCLPLDGEIDEQTRLQAEERSRRRREALKRRKDAYRRAQTAYYDALDEFIRLDLIRIRNVPKSREKPISSEYADAVKQLPTAKYQLDCAEMELFRIEQAKRQ